MVNDMTRPGIKVDTVVIGAGLTGLTASFYLARSGADFITIDLQERPGGVIRSHREGGFLFESGPNTGIIGQPEVVELFDELRGEVEPAIANQAVNTRLILKNGRWEPLPSGPVSAIRTPLFSLRDKIRILAEPFRPAGKNPDEKLSELVLRRMGPSFLDYAIDPFILGVYSGDPAQLVTRHAFPKLYQLEQNYGSFIGGAIRKKFKKKDERDKLATREVFSVKGGLERLVEVLYQRSGPEHFRLGFNQVEVHPDGSGLVVTTTDPAGNREEIEARNVITTTGAHTLPALFPFMSLEERGAFEAIRYAPVVEVALGFDRWEAPQPQAFGGLIPSRENRELLGILFPSSFLAGRAPEDGALLTIFMGGIRNPKWLEASDEEIRSTVEREVTDLMQLSRFEPSLFRIFRHRWAIPQYGPESDEKILIIDRLMDRNPGLLIGGNLKDGIGMADRIRQGRQLAETVIRRS